VGPIFEISAQAEPAYARGPACAIFSKQKNFIKKFHEKKTYFLRTVLSFSYISDFCLCFRPVIRARMAQNFFKMFFKNSEPYGTLFFPAFNTICFFCVFYFMPNPVAWRVFRTFFKLPAGRCDRPARRAHVDILTNMVKKFH